MRFRHNNFQRMFVLEGKSSQIGLAKWLQSWCFLFLLWISCLLFKCTFFLCDWLLSFAMCSICVCWCCFLIYYFAFRCEEIKWLGSLSPSHLRWLLLLTQVFARWWCWNVTLNHLCLPAGGLVRRYFPPPVPVFQKTKTFIVPPACCAHALDCGALIWMNIFL